MMSSDEFLEREHKGKLIRNSVMTSYPETLTVQKMRFFQDEIFFLNKYYISTCRMIQILHIQKIIFN